MSGLGQKQTFSNVRAMSALPRESGHCGQCFGSHQLHCDGGYMSTLRIDLACILPGMQRQSHAQDHPVRRRCVCRDWYGCMAEHQNFEPSRAG